MAPRILCRSKIIIHLRGGYFGTFYDNSGLITKKIIDIVMKRVRRVVVLGNNFKLIFIKWFPPESIDVVPNGTSIKINGVKNKFSKENELLTITFMSSLMRSKGIVDFLLSAEKITAVYKKVKFLVAGEWWRQEPELETEVKQLIMEKGLENYVTFLGLTTGEKKEKLLLDTDIFVLPSYYPFEGHPNVIIEAMAAGCAVISTDHAAIPETVIHNKTGLIIPIQSPDKLAEAIIYLVDNKEVLKSMAKESYKRYLQFYTPEKSTEKLIKSFMKALEN
jgi:glycosyltransferase involved in cell wall biosynthesis